VLAGQYTENSHKGGRQKLKAPLLSSASSIAGIVEIERDRKAELKTLPRINADKRGSGKANHKAHEGPKRKGAAKKHSAVSSQPKQRHRLFSSALFPINVNPRSSAVRFFEFQITQLPNYSITKSR
jgi:hypothetical protein